MQAELAAPPTPMGLGWLGVVGPGAITDILWTGSPRVRGWRGGDVRTVYYSVMTASCSGVSWRFGLLSRWSC